MITPSPLIKEITGVILAGGKSRRFGGNKALADWHGKPLIRRVTDILTGVFAECLVVTNTPAVYDFLGVPCTGDRYAGSGPLAGIHAALEAMETEWAFVAACDMPQLDPSLIRYLCRLALHQNNRIDAVLPWPGTGPEPLHAAYHARLAQAAAICLSRGDLSMGKFLGRVNVRRVEEAEIVAQSGGFQAFRNVNFPWSP